MNISNSYKQTLTLSNTAEIAENESRGSLTLLRWSRTKQRIRKNKYMNKKHIQNFSF